MSETKLFDLDALLAPIPGDNPAGGRVPLALRQKLEAGRKEFEPNPEGANLPPIAKKADWPGILKTTQESLRETSEDIEMALRMLEALTRLHDFAGLRDGLIFLRELLLQCWERVHPIPDPEDGEGMEVRAERFNWIFDVEAGARFPVTVKNIPLLVVNGVKLGFSEFKNCQEGKGEVSPGDLEQAKLARPEIPEEFEASQREFSSFEDALLERFQHQAPSTVALRGIIGEVGDLIARFTPKAEAPVVEGEAASAESGSDGQAGGGGTLGFNVSAAATREGAYTQVDRIADVLEKLEPHSPIPYLLRRAVALGRMPFHKLIKELVRDDAQVMTIFREYGIPWEG